MFDDFNQGVQQGQSDFFSDLMSPEPQMPQYTGQVPVTPMQGYPQINTQPMMTQQMPMMNQQIPMMNQQMPIMNQQMPMGYPQMQGYGYSQGFQQIRYTKGQIIQGLRDYVVNCSRVPINKEERIDDTPKLLRHACAECKVSQLGINQFNIPEMYLSIPFYFCKSCGKLYYPREIM